jgi:hypothetical protein
MITTLGEDIPGDIRRAVEGSLKDDMHPAGPVAG